MAFHRFAVAHPWIITAVSTVVSTPRLPTSPRSPQPATDRADRCLPQHRQAVGLQCFYHWRIADAFHRCPTLLSTGGSVRRCLLGVPFVSLG